ncbi:MAG: ATP-dependent RecD-like DNA helicase, partial [Proteobacteria bacterium]|nr:ATP-dependent RecD-like DNA helicase [Pseudomonadota bacterium]
MITLKGILHHVTFKNPDNHYTVAKLKIPKISDPVTIVGHLAGIYEGESLEITGNWSSHARYGDQFNVETFTVILPATVSGIRKYLGSGIISGVGKSLADKIVDHFQETTLDVIENEPDRLKEISGIGAGKQKLIEYAWNTHHAVRRVMQFLQENGVSVHHAAIILKTYGSKALEILQDNPYTIAGDLPDIGFSIADMIALKSGVTKDDENRLKACLIHCLLAAEQDGHVYGLKNELFHSAAALAGVAKEKFEQALQALEHIGDIRVIEENNDTQVYLKRLYTAESGIASRIKAMLSFPKTACPLSQDEILDKVLTRLAVTLSEEQLDVVAKVMEEKIVVITGGPGTGKTTLIRALCEIFSLQNLRITLAAPTGRAARRLSQVTGKKASTLHKLLGFDHENQSFERHFGNPLELDVFIVDEASMVDTILMYRLLEALPISASIIIVGDTFQLPSVGPGNVLLDIIESNT